MPVRHFLRRDYLHILFYITFLGFVSLVHQIMIYTMVYQFSFLIPQSGANFCCNALNGSSVKDFACVGQILRQEPQRRHLLLSMSFGLLSLIAFTGHTSAQSIQ